MIAFIDETTRSKAPGTYVLAAVAVRADDLSSVRAAIRRAIPAKVTRFHWRNESDGRRASLLSALSHLPIQGVACWMQPADPARQERCRALVMQRLLWTLEEASVTRVVLEHRGEALNRRDRKTIVTAQRAGWVDEHLAYEFGLPLQEPVLWAADAFVGAAGAALADQSERFVKLLPDGMLRTVPWRDGPVA